MQKQKDEMTLQEKIAEAAQRARQFGKNVYNSPEAQAVKTALLNAGKNSAEGRTQAFNLEPQAQKPPEQEQPEQEEMQGEEQEEEQEEKVIPEYQSALGTFEQPREYIPPVSGLGLNQQSDNMLQGFSGFRGVRHLPGFASREEKENQE